MQSYVEAGNMAGAKSGCTARIRKVYPKAHYYCGMNHDLNLAVLKSCNLYQKCRLCWTLSNRVVYSFDIRHRNNTVLRKLWMKSTRSVKQADVGDREAHFITTKKENTAIQYG